MTYIIQYNGDGTVTTAFDREKVIEKINDTKQKE